MKVTKVTDLEKFVQEHIYNPYRYSLPENEKVNLNNVVNIKDVYPIWWGLVIDRILKISIYFPYYINHPLVEIIKKEGIRTHD